MRISAVRQYVSISRQETALLAITAVWGSTFLLVHLAMRHSGPMFFVGVRFLVAGLAATLVFRRSMRGMTRLELGAGTAIGLMIFPGLRPADARAANHQQQHLGVPHRTLRPAGAAAAVDRLP